MVGIMPNFPIAIAYIGVVGCTILHRSIVGIPLAWSLATNRLLGALVVILLPVLRTLLVWVVIPLIRWPLVPLIDTKIWFIA
jgi:hypothetical protein